MKNYLFALSTLALFPGCVVVDGSPGGEPSSRTSRPADFDQLVITGFDHVQVDVCGDCAPLVKITGDDRQVDEVTLEIQGDLLEIGYRTRLVVTDIDLDVEIRVPSLQAFTQTGSSDSTIRGVRAGAFEIVNTGSGNLVVDGQVEVLDIVTSGSGDISAFDLRASTVDITSSGSGDTDVCASERLDVRLTGSGNVFYDCSPSDIDSDSTGSGKVSLR